MMEFYAQTFKIRESECDYTSRARLSALWDIFQTVAVEHADRLGFGYEKMREQGVFWVLSRMDAAISRYPKSGETVRAVTRPVGVSRVFAMREYHIFDAENNELTGAVSAWLVVDAETGRPRRPDAKLGGHPIFSVEYGGEVPQKLPELPNASYARDFHAEFCDVDINRHVNNSRYVNWAENLIVPRLGEKRISRICVNYLHETKMGEKLAAYEERSGYVTALELRNADGKPVFRADMR